jgi:hypothetical protein
MKMRWHGPRYEKMVRVKIDKTVKDSAHDIVDDIKSRWSSSAPSSAGNPPAVVTGELDRSMGVERVGIGVFKIGASNEISLKAMSLEFGTQNMAARPYLRPALRRAEKKLVKDIDRRLNR